MEGLIKSVLDSQKAQAAQLALEELIATRASLKALLLQQLNEEEELPIALPQGVDTSKPGVEPQHDEQVPEQQETRYQFASLKQFLQKFRPPPLQLSSCVLSSSPSTQTDVQPPSKVLDWRTFEQECQALLNAVEESGPAIGFTMDTPMDSIGSEAELQDQLLSCFLRPLQIAASKASKSFVCGRMRPDVEGLPASSGRLDFLLLSADCKTVLVAVEVKTSAELWVPPGRSMPDAYAAADKDSGVAEAVHQLYGYLDRVPYGVLLTDRQLFCMRREHTQLLCSPSIPLTAAEPGEAAAGSCGAGSLTAAAALYCTLRMSQAWWAQRRQQQQQQQQQQQPSGGSPGGGRGGGGGGAAAGSHQQRGSGHVQPGVAAQPPGSSTIMGVAVATAAAGAAPGGPTASPPAVVAESRCTTSQLFPGYRPDPQVPGHTPRRLADSSSAVVLEGAVGGLPAAVKLVDLWQGSEGKKLMQHEARMYQALQPLQGSYVPRLLGYGYCDGWQYFLATSLAGPSLNREAGWALGEEATRAGALAALDAVHACGVLHGDIALRNIALAASHWQPKGMEGGGAAGGAEGGGGGGGGSGEGASAWQQGPCVVLLDFGYATPVATAAEESGEEPEELFRDERQELQQLLECGPPRPPTADAAWGAQAAAAATSAASNASGDIGKQGELLARAVSPDVCAAAPADGLVVASRPSTFPAVHSSSRSRQQRVCLLPAPPPSSRPGGMLGGGGWRRQVQPLVPRRSQQSLAHHSARSASRASSAARRL